MRRLYGKYWKMDPEKRGSGVEQLKQRLEAADRRALKETREKVAKERDRHSRRRGEVKKSRAEIEEAANEMFKRAASRRVKLAMDIEKKQQEQVCSKRPRLE